MKIVIDGNIGCGKSTLIDKIMKSQIIDYPVYTEPVNEWNDWLKLFYADMKKHSFGFQMKILKSHFKRKPIENGIFERSPLSCQKVFGELLHEDLMLSKIELDLTNEYYYDYGWIPDVVIYLKASPKICYERINKRCRTSEELISLDYIERLDAKYEQMYNNVAIVHVITIDANQHINVIYEQCLKALDEVINKN